MNRRTSNEIRAEIQKLECELNEATKRESLEKEGVIFLPEDGSFKIYVHGMEMTACIRNMTIFGIDRSEAEIVLICNVD